MSFVADAVKKVLDGGMLGREEALRLVSEDLDELRAAADEVRRAFHGDDFDFCAIVNARSGRCSENCRFCAQSAFHRTGVPEHGMLSAEAVLADAKKKEAAGIPRYSMVTSGRTLSDADVDAVREATRLILAETKLSVCLSAGLLRREQFERLKEAGLTRFHNNLETSRRFFPSVCTTHSYDDKIAALENASAAGLEICSGGILGLGETMEDRIDMCLDLRALGVESTPMNVLNAIPGTPFESLPKLSNDDFCRTVAIFRLVNPKARLRLAGGRSVLGDEGERALRSGANAAITDDMLTTSGVCSERDFELVRRLGFRPHGFLPRKETT